MSLDAPLEFTPVTWAPSGRGPAQLGGGAQVQAGPNWDGVTGLSEVADSAEVAVSPVLDRVKAGMSEACMLP